MRVLLVDDHRVLREGLRASLEAAGVEIVGEAGDGLAAVAEALRLRPDIVVMDVALPAQDGVAAALQLRSQAPEVQVVVLTMFADGATLREAIRAGAAGYLVKDCSTAEIVRVLEEVAAGQVLLSPELAESLLDADRDSGEPVLSKREAEVLQLVAEGASTTDVAAKLFISVKTVKNHLSSIYEKLDARDRTQAVLQGLRLGIVQLH